MNSLKNCASLLAVACCLMLSEPLQASQRERLTLDFGWKFHPGDIAFPIIIGHEMTYLSVKAGRAVGAAAVDYDDTEWREVNLPHDWAVEGPFDEKANISQGYRPRGIAWYRREFKLTQADHGKHLALQFDGIATHATVWFNGTLVQRNWCGYTGFEVDITPLAHYGEAENVVVVRVDADAQEGWWYEGAGIYRHTWLVKRDATHILTDGVFVRPERGKDLKNWTVPVEIALETCGQTTNRVEVKVELLDPSGKVVSHAQMKKQLRPLNPETVHLSMMVKNPKLWDVDSPNLYTVKTTIMSQGSVTDEVTTKFGFRTFRFDANLGFFFNDQPMKIHGTCEHQGHAGVGVAVPEAIDEFRLRKLKEMGVNAVRCSHNPPNAEFLDACDRIGMMVMDENRNFNTSEEYIRQLQWMVRRDRNHASIILWSVFNEEPMQGTENGFEMVRRMSAVVKQLDTSRPVTAAMSSGQFNPINVSQGVDVDGFNYQHRMYDRYHTNNPLVRMTSSEDTSAYMTRGVFETDKSKNVMDSYDDQAAPWGATHREGWKAVATRPYLGGDFIWTGFDYRGEPTPFKWPSASSSFGCLDLCGFPKTAFFIHQAQWVTNRPILELVPHWNWRGREGKLVKVMALANCDSVALYLNGKLIEQKAVDKFEMPQWMVAYQPGKLEAVGYVKGVEVSRRVVETTGEPTSVKLTPDQMSLVGDGLDAMPVTVEVVDKDGRAVPTANTMVNFEMSGPARIIGVGNGDPNCHEPEKGDRRSLFNGLAQVILQSECGRAGEVVLKAKAEGLQTASIRLMVNQVAPIAAVEKTSRVATVQRWRLSPVVSSKPDPNQELADGDMNSWQSIETGRLQTFMEAGYTIYQAKLKPFSTVQKEGGKIVFDSIVGKAEVWLDKTLVSKKESFEAGPLSANLPPGGPERVLCVLIESKGGTSSGVNGAVRIQSLESKSP